MRFYARIFAVAGLGLGLGMDPIGAHAGVLDYNLALTGNLNGAVHVEGMTFVGGNLVSTQMSEFNHKDFTPHGSFDGLEVAGNVSGQLKIMNGETAVYGTKDAGAHIDCVGSVNCTTGGVNLSAKKIALSNEMTSLTSSYQGLSANAAAAVNGNQVKLKYTGTDDLAIFSLNAADIFFQNSGIELDLGAATKVVINVVGNITITNTNLNGNWSYSNTLWNFYTATAVDFGSMAVKGSVLAANADVFNASGFDGSLYAKSYTNTSLREIHGFFWTPPETEIEVPEPSMLILLLAGVGLIGLGQLRRRN
ncbi:MAG TPA: choice-of-anchor A family protein [Cellvibrio sp.]|nr:choice-of-anchor A family protein [Cellvibrio sp.]